MQRFNPASILAGPTTPTYMTAGEFQEFEHDHGAGMQPVVQTFDEIRKQGLKPLWTAYKEQYHADMARAASYAKAGNPFMAGYTSGRAQADAVMDALALGSLGYLGATRVVPALGKTVVRTYNVASMGADRERAMNAFVDTFGNKVIIGNQSGILKSTAPYKTTRNLHSWEAFRLTNRSGVTNFKSGGDHLKSTLGPARLSHPEEYASIMRDLEINGVKVDFRINQYAYGAAKGVPGNLVIDPDASISALRHEYGHFMDDKRLGFPGLGYYMENPKFRVASERRQYLYEIKTAKSVNDVNARRMLISDYLEEKGFLVSTYYTSPYGETLNFKLRLE